MDHSKQKELKNNLLFRRKAYSELVHQIKSLSSANPPCICGTGLTGQYSVHNNRPERDMLHALDVERGSKSMMMESSSGKHALTTSSRLESSSTSVPFSEEQHQSTPLCFEDRMSMLLLLLLYTLQGIPMGLCGSIPLILKEKGVTYEGLSLFSLVSLPFSLKLLWAPLVDSCYLYRIGRRKTWLVPVQFLTGGLMIYGAKFINTWMGNGSSSNGVADANAAATMPDVSTLSTFFFILYFLMATQDIAVDGWAITMLSRENVGYASVCNSIGQAFGFFVANQGFIALSDETWCRRHLGLPEGEVFLELAGFMEFWGWVFIVTTFLVWIFKSEKPLDPNDEPGTLLETFHQVYQIFRLKSVQTVCVILLTAKIAFAPADSVSGFKLQDYGMPKADIATISPLLLLVGLLLPAITSRAVSNKPLDMYMWGMPLKILTSLLGWVMVQYTSSAYGGGKSPSMLFFASLVTIMVLHEVAGNLMFISSMSFFAKISDPSIGGTYMTLLNTISNLGSKWPNSMALWLLPKLTSSTCQSISSTTQQIKYFDDIDCAHTKKACEAAGGTCHMHLDGYTVQIAGATIVGIIWIILMRERVLLLQHIPVNDWLVTNNNRAGTNDSRRKD